MTTPTVRTIACPCGAPVARPCATRGEHLARYLHAEQADAIGRDQLTAVIATRSPSSPRTSPPPPPTARRPLSPEMERPA